MGRPRCEYTSCNNCGYNKEGEEYVKGLCRRCYNAKSYGGDISRFKDKPERTTILKTKQCSDCNEESSRYIRGMCSRCYYKNGKADGTYKRSKVRTGYGFIRCMVCLHKERDYRCKGNVCNSCINRSTDYIMKDANRIKLILIKAKHFELDKEDHLRLISLFVEYVYGDDETKRPRFSKDIMVKSLTIIYKLITTGEYKEHEESKGEKDEG